MRGVSDTSGTARSLPAAAALVSLLVFALSANVLPAALLRASADLAVAPQSLAALASIQFAAFFVSAISAGILADRFGQRQIFLAACALLMAGAVVWAVARQWAHACAGAALWGAAGGVFEGLSSALLCELFPERRKLFMNLSQVFYTAGAVAGPWVAGQFLPRGVDWRLLFVGVGALGALLGLAWLGCRLPAPPPQERATLRRLLPELRTAGFLTGCAALFLYVLVESAVAVYANLYLRQAYAAPENWAIYSLALFWGAMLVGRGLCALLPERHSYERTLGALLLLSGGALAAQGLVGIWRASLALFTLAGLAFSGIWPLIVARASKRAARHNASLVGLTVAAGSLGCIAAPPLANALMDLLPLRMLFVALAVPPLLAAVLIAIPRLEGTGIVRPGSHQGTPHDATPYTGRRVLNPPGEGPGPDP